MPVTKVKSKWAEGSLVFSGDGKLNLGVTTTQKKTIETATGSATLSVDQMLAGHIDGTPVAAAAYTTPTATALLAEIPGAVVGTSFYFSINNVTSATHTITLGAGDGVTVDGSATIAVNTGRLFFLTVTNVSTPAITIYGMGA